MTAQSDLNRLLERERVARQILAQLLNFPDLESVLKAVGKIIKSLTACEALAIRLHKDGDYPYYVWDGFADSFIQHETKLCYQDGACQRVCEPDGKGYVLECLCGLVIRGRTDPSKPFFTPSGSFWTNSLTNFLAATTPEERPAATRNYCKLCGYESQALIPIRDHRQNVGLLQLNDHRKDMFSPDLIEYLETLAGEIGLAVRSAVQFAKLEQALGETRALHQPLLMCTYCKQIRNAEDNWHLFESYMVKRMKMNISHGLCPTCLKEHATELGLDARDFDVDVGALGTNNKPK
ncbi:MAG: GAF domain-containing protein [Lentisphaerae bacterium]|nr:GAF domain-containing protein [Lentisphaerota bacterium]